MSNFYNNLDILEHILDEFFHIEILAGGVIVANNQPVETNIQLEMISPGFFTSTSADNSTTNGFRLLFESLQILPSNTPEIPLIRDIPLRGQHFRSNDQEDAMYAAFLADYFIENHWTAIFPQEFEVFKNEIARCYLNTPKDKKKITHTPDGKALESGGYCVELHTVNGIDLYLHTPESHSEKDISTAVERSLNDTEVSTVIIEHLKPILLQKRKIAFNVRGISKQLNSIDEMQNMDLGGGHQYYLMLDRESKTIYAINNTRGATEENPRAFYRQLCRFLALLGDKTQYAFQFIQGKSRQPDNQSYLNHVCSVSQFIHYSAILAGVAVEELHDIIPAKVSTLMYLVQYASFTKNAELKLMLDELLVQINLKLANNDSSKKEEPPCIAPIEEEHRLDLITVVTQLISNIEQQKNGRKSSLNKDEKLHLLRQVRNELKNDPEYAKKSEADYIEELRDICAIKRYPFHFWAEPHSVGELEQYLSAGMNV